MFVIVNTRLKSDVGSFKTKKAAEEALKTFWDHSHMFSLEVRLKDYIIEERDD